MSDVKVLGRPAEYDKERSLNAALAVFWRNGYEATSMADLCEAMGMSKSTLYAVFGDKHQLFLSAIRAYSDDLLAGLRESYEMSAGPVEFIEQILRSVAREAGPRGERRGCLVMNSATEFAQSDRDVARIVSHTLEQMADVFATALARAKRDGTIRVGAPVSMALYLVSTIAGMKTMVKGGRSEHDLNLLVDMVMGQIGAARAKGAET
jgi:TetR/AcrR family transcriptional regulator, transcriptional repressor for nem operon